MNEIKKIVPYPEVPFLHIPDGLEPYQVVAWDSPLISEVLGFHVKTTNRDALITLRIIQARLLAMKDLKGGLMAYGVLGMQAGLFRSQHWARIFGGWLKDIRVTNDEFDAMMRFCFHMDADIVTLTLICHDAEMNIQKETLNQMMQAWRMIKQSTN